jgi:hypothetical protein
MAHSEEINTQYPEGAAAMPRSEGGGVSSAAALNRERTRQGRTEMLTADAIATGGS